MIPVDLVAMTVVDWRTYDDFCIQYADYRPSRVLDASGIKQKSVGSLVRSLEPNTDLRLCQLSFVAVLQSDVIYACQNSELIVTHVTLIQPDVSICLVTGTLDRWMWLLKTKVSYKKPLASFISNVYKILKNTDLNNLLKSVFNETIRENVVCLEVK